jgi:rhodanese-related sulfurtransferase
MRITAFWGLLAMSGSLALSGCAHRVSGAQAKKMVDEGAKLVDVRSAEEYASEHLPGAINVPLGELLERLGEIGPRDQAVVVYCHTGFRAMRAASKLTGAGYTHVGDLGAMSNWPDEAGR